MKNWISLLGVFFLALSLTACSTMESPNPDNSKAYVGLFSGAIVGGLAGSAIKEKGGGRVSVIAACAAVGAIIGGGLGLFLSDKDRENAAAKTRQQTYRDSHWQQASYAPVRTPIQQPVTTAERKPVNTPITAPETPVAEKKPAPVVPLNPPKKEAAAVKVDQDKDKNTKEMADNNVKIDEKLSKLMHHLPSLQWFVNDVKQEEVG